MKKIIFSVAAALLTLTSCNQKKVEELQARVDSLQSVNDLKDSSMGLLAETMSDIQNNIATIKEKEGIISVSLAEGSTQNQIQNDLNAIEQALESNKKKVASLQAQLAKATKNSKELEAIISVLNSQIEQQNQEIARLNTMLEEKNIEIGFLNNAVIKLSTSVDSLAIAKNKVDESLATATDELETAWYVVGEKGFLKDNGLIETGLFKGKKATGNFEEKLFTKVNIKEVKSIPLNVKKVSKVVSVHPEDSYSLDEGADGNITLNIKNQEKFWATTHYLIIIGK
ncbi:MAG: hypothetical protein MJZ15_09325 [Bacteroidales bacterium]|nr:hypothetical protein [Bacteroidales bacterium]